MFHSKFIITIIIFLSLGFSNTTFGQIDHWDMVVEASNDWRYFIGNQEPPASWKEISFNDNAWDIGPGGIGYSDGDDATIISSCSSLYMRRDFTVSDLASILDISLYIDYDDAFVAYVNNVEIARSNIGTSGVIPSYNTMPNTHHEAVMYQGGEPESFSVSSTLFNGLLQQGVNTLAIHIINNGASSSDLSAIPFLFLATSSTSTNGIPLPYWFNQSSTEFSSHLPILNINTNGQNIQDSYRIIADMTAFFNDNGDLNYLTDTPTNYDGLISIEIRGHSSQMFDKKAYSFETQLVNGDNNNVSLLGLPSENDWVLHGPYSDKSLIRNALVYELARETGWYAPRTVFCEIFINEDYRGVYVLVEKLKRDDNRVDIDKMDINDNAGDSVTGGYIFKVDWPDDGSTFDWHSPVQYYNGSYLDLNYQFEYPERGKITNEQAEYIEDNVTDFELALSGSNFTDINSGYRKYADLHSFADNFLIQEISNNVDAYRLSNFYTKVRDSKGGKIIAGPVWDFNLAFGNADYGPGWQTYGWALENSGVTNVIPFHLKKMREDPEFEDYVKCRWEELRSTTFSINHINYLIDSMVTYLGPAIDRNFERWNILGNYVWPNYYVGNTHAEEITYLKDFIEDRVTWIDNNLPGNSFYCNSFYNNKIIITEINYQDADNFTVGDWFEIYNNNTAAIDISGWVVKDENNLNSFTFPPGTLLNAGQYLVVCENISKFNSEFSSVNNAIGSFNWKLSQNDHIRLFDTEGYTVCEVNYDNDNDWPTLAQGEGETIELLDIASPLYDPLNWYVGCPGGSPGTEHFYPCPPLQIESFTTEYFSIYPNPVADILNINSDFYESIEFEIFSIDGKSIYSSNLSNGETTVDAEFFAPGIYNIKIKTDNGYKIVKFVKE